MAISFVDVSANVSAASGDITITPPATITDDIMILGVSSHDNVEITLPAGWTIIDAKNNDTVLRATIAWKRCVGAEGAFTVTHTAGDGIVGNVAVYRGVYSRGNPIYSFLLQASVGASSTVNCGGGTIYKSIVDGCMLLFLMHDSDNGVSSSQAEATLGNMTERFDNASTAGLDQAVSLADFLETSASGKDVGNTYSFSGSKSFGADNNIGSGIVLLPGDSGEGYSNNYQFASSVSAGIISVTEKIK